jgi:hypothetical protein
MLQQALGHFCVIEPMHSDQPSAASRWARQHTSGLPDKCPFGAKNRTHLP